MKKPPPTIAPSLQCRACGLAATGRFEAAAFRLMLLLCLGFWASGARGQPAAFERRETQVGSETWSYHRAGAGQPLVLLHGFGASKQSWSFLLPYLTDNYDVIAPDLPGFGESSKSLEADYSLAAQVDRLAQFLEALGLETVHIGGNSMGGSIAGEFAARRPERVRSLWLICAAGVWQAEPSDLDKHLQSGGDNIMIPRSVEEFDRLMEWLYNQPPPIPDFAKDAIVAEIGRNAPYAEKAHQDLIADWPDLAQSLRGFDKPTLITWGEDDRFAHVSGARILRDVLPQSQFDIIPNCGHVPMLELPERTAQSFLRFAETAEPPVRGESARREDISRAAP